jgi:U32 family peptidase
MKEVELLLPAKNLKSIKAVEGYANAVYFGSDTLNMRMRADNFSLESIPELVKHCHSVDLKAYLTTNVIIYEHELDLLSKTFKIASESEIDAVIIHDMAAIGVAKEHNLPFHISTQASVSNSRAAEFYQKLGAQRIILARELSLDSIKEISNKLKESEVEIFIHGAQCTSISGRCYLSAYACNDPSLSANRGQCVQPCRNKWTLSYSKGAEMDYDGIYFLNSKDMCMIEHIPELLDSRIRSLKVEGRMRDPHYIEIVAKCYREAIDSVNEGTFSQTKVDNWLKDLKSVYNRGFSTGFYYNIPNINDIAQNTSGNQATTRKIQIGKVTNYFRNVQAAKIELFSGQLKIGDEIIFEGSKEGNYLKHKITSMQIKKKQITETPAINPHSSIIVGMKLEKPVKKGDYVYIYQ